MRQNHRLEGWLIVLLLCISFLIEGWDADYKQRAVVHLGSEGTGQGDTR